MYKMRQYHLKINALANRLQFLQVSEFVF